MAIPTNPSGLPKGTGSLQVRGRTWWMIFRDAQGRIIQQNTGTTDQREARRILARAAAAAMREVLAELERIADEGQGSANAGKPARPRAHRSPAAADARNRKTGIKGGK